MHRQWLWMGPTPLEVCHRVGASVFGKITVIVFMWVSCGSVFRWVLCTYLWVRGGVQSGGWVHNCLGGFCVGVSPLGVYNYISMHNSIH